MFKILVSKQYEDYRLDVLIAKLSDNLSRSRVKQLIEEKNVQINNNYASAATKVKENDQIIVHLPEIKNNYLAAENIKIDIIYQDDDIVVVNKAAGMVVHPGAGVKNATLVNALLFHFPQINIAGSHRPGIVHRLDKNTSGLMVCAKNDIAHRILSDSFKQRKVSKTYIAFCLGGFKEKHFELKTGHCRHPKNRKKFFTALAPPISDSNKSIRLAHSKFNVLANKDGISELEVNLLTGRTHQIRAHLADIGKPLVCDELYGGVKPIKNICGGKVKQAAILLKRHALHAYRLSFQHPTTKKQVSYCAQLPDDLLNLHNSFVQ